MRGLEGLRFLYVTGKGGVGKSTVAAVIAYELARRGRRTLLVAEAGALGHDRLLGRTPSLRPQELAPRFHCMAIDAEQAMKEYAEAILKSRRLVDTLFHSQVARGFLGGIPGLSAWAFLGKAWSYAEDEYVGPARLLAGVDTVVVDAPATGDSTDLLRVPAVIGDLAPRGRFRRDAELCEQLLHDPKRTAVIPVTLLEELPVTETEELLRTVQEDLRMPLGPLFLNQIRPEIFSAGQRQALLGVSPDPANQDPAQQVIALAAQRAQAEHQASLLTVRLQSLSLPLIRVPHQRPEPAGLAGLAALARALAEEASPGYRAQSP